MDLTQEKIEQLENKVQGFSQRQYAIEKLKKSSITFPSQPAIPDKYLDEQGQFKIPSDITTLEDSELGELMSIINELLLWYGASLAYSRVDRQTAERVKNYVESQVRMEIFADRETEKRFKAREDKEAFINSQELVVNYQLEFDKQEAMVIFLEQLYKDMERSFMLVSREITRRGSSFSHQMRTENIE